MMEASSSKAKTQLLALAGQSCVTREGSTLSNQAYDFSEGIKERLDSLALETRRDRQEIVESALDRYLSFEEKQMQLIKEGLYEIENHPERLIPGKEIDAWIDTLKHKESQDTRFLIQK